MTKRRLTDVLTHLTKLVEVTPEPVDAVEKCGLCGHPILHCLCTEYAELAGDPVCDCGHKWSDHRVLTRIGAGEPCDECDCGEFVVSRDAREEDRYAGNAI